MGATKHIECPKGTIENSHVGSGNVAGGEASIGKRNDTSLQQPLPLTTPQSVLVPLLSQRIPRAGWFLCQVNDAAVGGTARAVHAQCVDRDTSRTGASL